MFTHPKICVRYIVPEHIHAQTGEVVPKCILKNPTARRCDDQHLFIQYALPVVGQYVREKTTKQLLKIHMVVSDITYSGNEYYDAYIEVGIPTKNYGY